MKAAALPRAPRGGRLRRISHPFAAAFLFAVAALVIAPLVNLVLIALERRYGDLWPHLAAYVMPPAALNTRPAARRRGAGRRGRRRRHRLDRHGLRFSRPRRADLAAAAAARDSRPTSSPMSMPTCSTRSGRCRRRCARCSACRSAADYWFPNVRSLGGAVLVMGFVLYPYVYLAARAMFQTQSAALIETARRLGATPLAAGPRHRAAAGAAGASRRASRSRCSKR